MTITVYDGGYTQVGQVPNYISAEVTWQLLAVGTGTLVVEETDPVAPYLLAADRGVVPVVASVNGQRWSGRVMSATLDREGPPGSGTVTATLADDFAWLQHMLASQGGSSTSLTGMPEYDRRTGKAATVAAALINASATRLGVPVKAATPVSDTSPTLTLNSRMAYLADALTTPLWAAGVPMPARIWLPGDDQPISGTTLVAPTVVFYPQAPTPKPWLQWTDSMVNIEKMSLVSSHPTAYRAIIGLNGQEAARIYDTYTDTVRQGQVGGYGFPELYVDDSSIDAAGAEAKAAAAAELAKTVGTVSASFTVEDADPWVFGTDYVVGDVATVVASGVTWQQAISQVTASDDRDNGFTLTPVVGDPQPAPDGSDMMVAALGRVAASLRTLRAGR